MGWGQPGGPDILARGAKAEALLMDLDRCEHGRHEGDPCAGGCPGGYSLGNPYMGDGADDDRQIGFDLVGNPIRIPRMRAGGADLRDADQWRTT